MGSYSVSVIIPVYNAERYIARCVQSLLEQTLDNIEFIFVDDCSTDNTLYLLNEYVAAYKHRSAHIQVICHDVNKGSATARNAGLLHATGEYIGWVDSDDWVEPEMFEMLYKAAEKEDMDLVWSDFYFTSSSMESQKTQLVEEKRESFLQALIEGTIQGMLWNKIAKRSLFIDYGIRFPDGCNMAEDRNVCIKLACFSQKIKHLPKALYHYTQYNPLSLTRDLSTLRVYEEINNTHDVLHFFALHHIEGLSVCMLNDYKFRTKKKLLFSSDINDLLLWANVFPESNDWLYSSKDLFFRHKLIAWLSVHCSKRVLKLYLVVKKMRQKRIIKK